MAGRGLDSNFTDEAESDFFRFIHFVKIELDTGTLYLHNGLGEYTVDGNVYSGLGDFGSIEPIKEGGEVSSYPIRLVLSGIDDALKESGVDIAASVLGEDFYGRNVTIYVNALDTNGALTSNPTPEFWSGQMQSPELQIGRENVVVVTAESDMAIFDRRNGSRYSDSDLQEEYSGDLGFEFLDQMIERRTVWRGKEAVAGAEGGKGGRGGYGGNSLR